MSVWGASRLKAALMAATMAGARLQGNGGRRLFPRLLRALQGPHTCGARSWRNQLFSSDLILLSNSAKEVSPLIFSPLMKKVGVESTFSTSLAYFWSAAILSSSAWSFRQSSTACWLRPACLPIRISVSVVFFNTQSFCCLNSMSITAKYLPASSLAMQRASMEPAAALMSSGNSRNTYRILPVSIYSDLIFGNTASLKAAQCGQVIDANSVIVTGAFGTPSAMSGNDTGLATPEALCPSASTTRRNGEKLASAASPGRDRAAVKARRVMNNLNQLFSSGLITLSKSSNVAPLTRSPLMKKLGVESTFSTSLAYF